MFIVRCFCFCLSFTVAAEVRVHLHLPTSGDIDVVERRIESRLAALRTVNDDEMRAAASKLDSFLSLLGIKRGRFWARKTKSITTLFICESVEQLHLLYEHYKSGWMKRVLEKVFTCLADEPVEICRLEWATDQYDSCLHQFGTFYFTRMLR
jgi:hypothetical protein